MNGYEQLYEGQKKQEKSSSEVGVVKNLNPFTFEINGVEYSSEDFTMYVPAVDRIKQYEMIECMTPNTINGEVTFGIGDLELEPDRFERRFLVGDLIDVTDRGDTFIIHGRLVKHSDPKVVYSPTHRDVV